MKFKAAILEKLNSPLILDDIEMPKLDCGQVLVSVRRSGICGAQLGEISGVKGEDKFLPHLLGHEGGGVVLETGPGVTQVKEDDHVVLHWRKGAGIHSRTPKYRWGSRTVNAGWVTTFNELAIVSENRVTPIPKDIDLEVAALLGCAVTTGLGLINNDAQLKIGQSIAVFGCGGVGLSIVQGAAMVSADPIIAIDIYDHKLKAAAEFGATHCINSTQTDLSSEVRKIAGSKGVDVVVDNTGIVKLIEAAYSLTAPQGRTILVGVPRKGDNISIYSLPLHFKKILTGSEGGDSEPHNDIPRYVRLAQAGKFRLDGLITHEFRLEQINDAIALVRGGEAGRVLVKM